MGFSLTLLSQFIEDMEAYAEVWAYFYILTILCQPTNKEHFVYK